MHRHQGRLASQTGLAALVTLGLLAGAAGAQTSSSGGPYPQAGSLGHTPLTPNVAKGSFLATAQGPPTVLSLPAALAFGNHSRSILNLDIVEGHYGGGSLYWQPGRFALGYRHIDRRVLGYNEDHYVGAISQTRGTGAFATDLAWIKNDVAGTPDAWTVGASIARRSRSGKWSMGFKATNLNRPRFLDGRLSRAFGLGLGWRPWGRRLTIAADGILYDEEWNDFVFRGGFETEPFDGFMLSGSLDNQSGFRLAIAIRDRQQQVGYGYGDNGNGLRRQLVHLGFEERPAPSRFDRGGRTGSVELRGSYRDDRRHGMLTLGPRYGHLQSVTATLERLRDDPGFDGLVLEIGSIGGRAAVDEIRRGVLDLRAEGKQVVAFIDGRGSFNEFYLASAADRVVFPGGGVGGLFGVASVKTYYRGLLDKLGIGVERFPCRDCIYKSAFSTYTDREENPHYQEQTLELVEAFHHHLVTGIAEGRDVPVRVVEDLADGRLLRATHLEEAGLIDRIGTRATADTLLAELLDRAPQTTARVRPVRPRSLRWGEPPRVAVIVAQGTLVEGRHRSSAAVGNLLGAHSLAATVRRVRSDPRVHAAVLRIDSPGGSMFGADVARADIERLAETKPLIVSMGPIAASGGYAIAAPAQEIYALPLSITGSVGVTFMRGDAAAAYERLDIHQSVTKTGESVDLFNIGRALSEQERTMLLDQVDDSYWRFLEQVAGDRDMSMDEVQEVARGRVYTGERAIDAGLVDRIGDLDDAVEAAALAAGLGDDYEVRFYRRTTPSLWQRLRTGRLLGETPDDVAAEVEITAAFDQLVITDLLGLELWDQPLALLEDYGGLVE